MNFTEAFSALGYDLKVPRSDWSAEKPSGVCISIWATEMRFSGGVSSFDTRTDARPIEGWGHKRGNKLRKKHLGRAVAEMAGRVDVVISHGVPGAGLRDAAPWLPGKRGASWLVTYFDPLTGHYAAEARANA